jgi:hypothetical protein
VNLRLRGAATWANDAKLGIGPPTRRWLKLVVEKRTKGYCFMPKELADSPTATGEEVGPIDVMLIEFTDRLAAATALPPLIDLADRGLIRVLDLVVIRKEADGSVTRIDLGDIDQHGQSALLAFDGVSSGILDQGDIDQAAAQVQPGCAAGLLVYEHRWAEPFITAIRRAGGSVLVNDRVPVESVLAALDSSESS